MIIFSGHVESFIEFECDIVVNVAEWIKKSFNKSFKFFYAIAIILKFLETILKYYIMHQRWNLV